MRGDPEGGRVISVSTRAESMDHGTGVDGARSLRRTSHNGSDPRVAALLQLQRSVGNAAVGRALRQYSARRGEGAAPRPVESTHDDHPICADKVHAA